MPSIGELEKARKDAGLPDGVGVCFQRSTCVQCLKEIPKGEAFVSLPYAYGRIHYDSACIAHHFLGVISNCKKQMEKWGVE